MDDDFNTAKAMGHLFEIAKIVNSYDEDSPDTVVVMHAAKDIFDTIGNEVFGLVFETETENKGIVDDLMNLIIELRSNARKEKNWELSDVIRDRLKKIGIILEDRPDGTTWKLV